MISFTKDCVLSPSSINYLDKHMADAVPPGRGEEWTPLLTYRNSLCSQGEVDMSMAPPPSRRGRGRGKRKATAEGTYTAGFGAVFTIK